MTNDDPERWLKRLARRLFEIDLRTLAALRIGMAIVVLIDVGFALNDVVALYSDWGVFPREIVLHRFGYGFGPFVHLFSGSTDWQCLWLGVHAVAALSLLVGFWTHLSTIVCWILLISLQTRNPMVLQGSDMVMRLLLFWGMFLPLGAKWSIDAARRGALRLPTTALSISTAAIMIQVCLVYWFTAILKWGPAWHQEGTAIYYALNIDYLTTPLGRELVRHFELTRILTHVTLWIEYLAPTLVFLPIGTRRVRLVVVPLMWGFHFLGLGLCMRLGMFPAVSSLSWVVFLPSLFWDRAESLLPVGWRAWCEARASALRRLFERHFPLRGDVEDPVRSSLLANVAAAGMLVYILIWNVRSLDPPKYHALFPEKFWTVGYSLHLDQAWAMFAPTPLVEDGWFVTVGVLKDGSEVDLRGHGAPPDWSKPPSNVNPFPNFRWRSYFACLALGNQRHLRPYYLDYLCRTWNLTHHGDREVETAELYYMMEPTLPDYRPPKVTKVLLWAHACGSKLDPAPLPPENNP